MDDNRILVGVVILGVVAIVMMGMVAKIALLETKVANEPGQMDNLRQKRRPPIRASAAPPQTSLTYEGADAKVVEPSGAAEAAPKNDAGSKASPAESRASAEAEKRPAFPAAGGRVNQAQMDRIAEEAEKSLVRITVVDHKEKKNGVAAVVGAGGALLASAPFLAGGYEAWVTLPESKRETPPIKTCLDWAPDVNLAVVRVDDAEEPLAPLPLADALPENGDKVLAFYESGQITPGRSEATVQGLLNTSDVAKKLNRDMSQFGDAVWIEALGSFPPDVEGAPLVNHRGELAGVALLDMTLPSAAASTVFGGGGVGGAAFGGAVRPAMTTRRIYAVSHRALERMVEKSSSSPGNQLLFTLPASRLKKPATAATASWSVKLPGGETLTAKTFEPTARVGGTGTLNYPAGSRCAALALSDRKEIDGPVTIHDRNGREMLRWNFLQGRRQGAMCAFASDGGCLLAAEFQRNDRHGYCVYFKDGAPWLVQEYADGKLGAQHLVKEGAVFYTVPPGKSVGTIETVLAQYGAWSDWDARLTAVAVALSRWAKEWDRTRRLARGGRANLDSLNAAQQAAVSAIERFRSLVN